MANTVITRFPPSPTGNLHIGNIRSLLFNYLYARKHDGEVVMRFEDTDTQRSKKEYEDVALETLEALGLDFDHGPFRQSERTEKYIEALNTLIEKDLAYVAEESEGQKGGNVIRFRNPNKEITFEDVVRGTITIDTTDFGDFVIARSQTSPIYHLTVVVDDIDMGITHVIRGEDHITSTPRQILLIEALGGSVPTYAHLPLIVGDDKKKLGKRHGAVTYQEFKDLGYVPAAIVNYLALLGWNPGDDREFFTKDELISEFSLERVNNSPATFSYEKLDSINKHHIGQMEAGEYRDAVIAFLGQNEATEQLRRHERFDEIIEIVIRERISKFSEALELFEAGEFNWLLTTPEVDTEEVTWKDSGAEKARTHLQKVAEMLENAPEWTVNALREAVWPYAEEHGKGDVLWPTRYSLTGAKKSPDPFTVAYLLGKKEALERLHYVASIV